MYEVEVEHIRLAAGTLPPDVRSRFLEPRRITHLGHSAWEEHCTECAWPQCYTTCDLYNRRNDGNCRRTVDGFSPVVDAPMLGGHVVRVRFKRWGNLTANCHLALRPVTEVEKKERRLNTLGRIAASQPNLGRFIGRPGLPSRVVRRLKQRSVGAEPAANGAHEPNCFVMEVYNPGQRVVELSLDISARGRGIQRIPFRRLLKIEPGFHRAIIPFEEIRPSLGDARETNLGVNPNILEAAEEGLTLFFGLMTFAYDLALTPAVPVATAGASAATKKVKVVIWDLDNTAWSGILIEDGPGRLSLRPGVRDAIVALDARGIVNSIASKNHEESALAELERLGLRDYFVFPAISWGPKSDAVRQITRSFNVGEDTVAFIDDQPFEREEVRSGNPMVRLYTHEDVTGLLAREEFDVPVTDEARSRRAFYQNEEVRQQALSASSRDYLAFLRQSNIRIEIARSSGAQIDRIHELVQRTNQMNFSGNRYSKADLLATLASHSHECFLVDAEDNYGKYGSIGFAVVRRGEVPRVIDLAFSCRIQSKRVEHAVLTSLMAHYAASGASELEVSYRATEKNQQVAQVFHDLGFLQATHNDNDSVYRRDTTFDEPPAQVVTVTFRGDVADAEPG
jgi:FkbH-like protein